MRRKVFIKPASEEWNNPEELYELQSGDKAKFIAMKKANELKVSHPYVNIARLLNDNPTESEAKSYCQDFVDDVNL